MKEEIKCLVGSVFFVFKIDDLVIIFKVVEVYRIIGNKDKIVEFFKIGDVLDDLLLIVLRDVFEECVIILIEVLSIVVVIGILIDIGFLIWNVLEFIRF